MSCVASDGYPKWAMNKLERSGHSYVPPAARDDQLIVERLLFALRHARRGVVELGLKTAQVL